MSGLGPGPDDAFVGLVPAAGRARRLAALRYPKELLPMTYELADDAQLRPRAVAEYALEAIALAGVRRVLIVVAPWKLDVVGYVGDGRALGVEAAYLYQEQARGLPHALDLGRPWCRGRHTVFAMPDTIFRPRDALARLRARYLATRADLALAVFPTDEPQRLAPVVLRDGAVVRVLDKPERPPVANTWGAAIWGERFGDLLHEVLQRDEPADAAGAPEPVLGHVFSEALRRGLTVVAEEFPDGSFQDAGTTGGILRTLAVEAAVSVAG